MGLSETPVQEHPRVHLDLYAGDAADQAAEVERRVALGAERGDWDLYPENADFIVNADVAMYRAKQRGRGRAEPVLVLAEPDGNRFCVIDTSHGQATSSTDDDGRP